MRALPVTNQNRLCANLPIRRYLEECEEVSVYSNTLFVDELNYSKMIEFFGK